MHTLHMKNQYNNTTLLYMKSQNMNIQSHEYKNGFRIIYESPVQQEQLPLTSIMCFVKYGSIYESKSGIAHFIEHMCFKGTKHLSTTKDIAKVYDNIGAYFNAFTMKEYTMYIIKCNEEYVSNCIHVLSDMLVHSAFKKRDCELELQVVAEEMRIQDNNPEFHIAKMKDRLLYAGSMFSRPIDDIENNLYLPFDHRDAIETFQDVYRPSNMCLSVLSNLSFHTIKRMVSSSFFMKDMTPLVMYPSYQLNRYQSITYKIQEKKGVTATHVSISFRTCPYNSIDKYTIDLLSHIIGGSMVSRMFTLLREQHGLTYTTSCNYTCYKHMGDITLYTMTDPKKMMKYKDGPGVLSFMIKLLNDLVKNGITQQELVSAKGYCKGKMVMQLETSNKRCEYNGLEYFVYDTQEIVPFDRLYDVYYSSITKKQVNDIIKKYFRSETMVVCIFGEHVPNIHQVKLQCKDFIG